MTEENKNTTGEGGGVNPPKPPAAKSREHAPGCACQSMCDGSPLTQEEISTISSDPAAGSLARALKSSFLFLKAGMLLLLIFFIADRFRSVNEGEVMVVKQFGAYISDESGIKVFKPGQYHFVWPYPIEEAVVVRVAEEKRLELSDTFWPRLSAAAALEEGAVLGAVDELDPGLDGYNLTGDLNILHTRWIVAYNIRNFRDYLLGSRQPLEQLRAICEDAIVRNFAGISVDNAYYGDRQALFDRISEDISVRLATTPIGIELVSLINTSLLPPGKTQPEFDRLTSSLSERQKLIDQARTEANAITKDGQTQAMQINNKAIEYRVATVSRAEADAARIRQLLARFPNDPQGLDIFLQQYRYDRLREALAQANIYILREGNNIFWTSPGPADFSDATGE